MKKQFEISSEELEAIKELGGFKACRQLADQVLREHGINRSLFSEAEAEIISGSLAGGLSEKKIEFHFDPGKSLRANIEDLLLQAKEVQKNSGGTNYVGAMLQHLVGAKLDLVLGRGKVKHHGFSVADHSTARKGDYQVNAVAIHVTTHPTEALMRKCADNLKAGLKPLIITIGEGVTGAAFLLRNSGLADRVDVLDAAQFLTANVYERSLFHAGDYKLTLTKLLQRYNEIVSECEVDPALQVNLSNA
jgi:hypothetical protein